MPKSGHVILGIFIAGVAGVAIGTTWTGAWDHPHEFEANVYPDMPLRPFDRAAWIGTPGETEVQHIRARNGMRESVKSVLATGVTVMDVIKLLGPPEYIGPTDGYRVSDFLSDGMFEFAYTIDRWDDGVGPLHDYSWADNLNLSFSSDGHLTKISEGPDG